MPTPEVQSFVSRQEFDQHEKHTESFQAATFPENFKQENLKTNLLGTITKMILKTITNNN